MRPRVTQSARPDVVTLRCSAEAARGACAHCAARPDSGILPPSRWPGAREGHLEAEARADDGRCGPQKHPGPGRRRVPPGAREGLLRIHPQEVQGGPPGPESPHPPAGGGGGGGSSNNVEFGSKCHARVLPDSPKKRLSCRTYSAGMQWVGGFLVTRRKRCKVGHESPLQTCCKYFF